MVEWPMSSVTINIHSYLLVSRDRDVVVGCAYTHELIKLNAKYACRQDHWHSSTMSLSAWASIQLNYLYIYVLTVIECTFVLKYVSIYQSIS